MSGTTDPDTHAQLEEIMRQLLSLQRAGERTPPRLEISIDSHGVVTAQIMSDALPVPLVGHGSCVAFALQGLNMDIVNAIRSAPKRRRGRRKGVTA